jgi:hypothetical protein
MGATAALRSGLCGAQSKSWTEIEWESLQFYGAALGAGAQGTVRKARWNGSDCAVKIFNPADVRDFTEEVRCDRS